jgi:aspartate racemase
MMNARILGVLGGMGPLASAHFMMRLTLLTQADCDQDQVPAVLWSDPRIPDRATNIYHGGADPYPWFADALDKMASVGCGAFVIPCNTAHYWYDRLQRHTALPILHIGDATAAVLRETVPKGAAVGILGTTTTLDMRLYQDRLEANGWRSIVPSQTEMDEWVMPAISMVKANRVALSHDPIARAAARLVARGARAIVLGCTELPLAVQAGTAERLGVALIDTIDALALAAIDWAKAASPEALRHAITA